MISCSLFLEQVAWEASRHTLQASPHGSHVLVALQQPVAETKWGGVRWGWSVVGRGWGGAVWGETWGMGWERIRPGRVGWVGVERDGVG